MSGVRKTVPDAFSESFSQLSQSDCVNSMSGGAHEDVWLRNLTGSEVTTSSASLLH